VRRFFMWQLFLTRARISSDGRHAVVLGPSFDGFLGGKAPGAHNPATKCSYLLGTRPRHLEAARSRFSGSAGILLLIDFLRPNKDGEVLPAEARYKIGGIIRLRS